MLTLIKNADVYAPEHLGLKDLLLEGGKIALIAPRGAVPESFPTLRVFDAQAQVLAPGFIDLHVHVTGGGGEDGFSSRSPESRLTDFSTAGVTTLVGLLGTDGVARSLEALYAGCNIVVTDKGSVREYFGDHAYYCEPDDLESIRNAVGMAMKAPPPSQELRRKIVSDYSWSKAAEQTLSAYEKVLSAKS